MAGYLGHDPELFNDSVENNVLMGEQKKTEDFPENGLHGRRSK